MSVASSSYLLFDILGNVLAAIAFVPIVVLYLGARERIILYEEVALSLGVIYLLMIGNIFVKVALGVPLQGEWYRVIGGIVISIVCLVIVPVLFDIDETAYVITRIAAAVVLIGLPSVVIGSHKFLGVVIDPYVDFELFVFFGPEVPAIVSIYPDTNAASKIALFGMFLSLYEYRRRRGYVAAGLLLVNAIGVYFTHSRGAFFAIFCGVVVYATARHGLEGVTVGVLYALVLSATTTFLLLVGLLPAPEFVANVELSYRSLSWNAAIAAFLDNPLIGMGFGEPAKKIAPYFAQDITFLLSPQNSYLRMFVATGVLGGLSYLFLIVWSVRNGIRRHALGKIPVEVLALCVALMILQIFENFSLFGVNQSSVMAAILFGYLVVPDASEQQPSKQ